MPEVVLDDTITIALSVSDRHKTAAWFEEMLGFKLLYHIDEAGWSELSSNVKGVIIGLGEQASPTPGNAVPVFGTPDIAASRQALEDKGVKFDGPTETIPDMVSTTTFYDPDGNALMLAQDLMK